MNILIGIISGAITAALTTLLIFLGKRLKNKLQLLVTCLRKRRLRARARKNLILNLPRHIAQFKRLHAEIIEYRKQCSMLRAECDQLRLQCEQKIIKRQEELLNFLSAIVSQNYVAFDKVSVSELLNCSLYKAEFLISLAESSGFIQRVEYAALSPIALAGTLSGNFIFKVTAAGLEFLKSHGFKF